MKCRTLTAAAVSLAALAVIPAGAGAAEVGGVVVKRETARSFLVSGAKGELTAVSGRPAPRVGTRVRVKGRKLAGGELRARKVTRRGSASRARVRGVVSHVNGADRRYTISSAGGSLTIARRKTGQARSAAVARVDIGDVVVITITISRGADLAEGKVREIGHVDEFDLEGTLIAFDAEAGTLTILPEDDGSSEAAAVVHAPQGFDFSLCDVGQEIEAEVSYDPATGYTLLDGGDSDFSEDSSSDGEDWDYSRDSSSSNVCGDSDSSEDGSGDDEESDSSYDESRS